MKYERKTFKESFLQVKSVRHFICPNEGFVVQLQLFEKELEAQHFGGDIENTKRENRMMKTEQKQGHRKKAPK